MKSNDWRINRQTDLIAWSNLIIVSVKVFQTRLVFKPRRWTFHERVNTDEHRARDNVHIVRDRPKNFYSNCSDHNLWSIHTRIVSFKLGQHFCWTTKLQVCFLIYSYHYLFIPDEWENTLFAQNPFTVQSSTAPLLSIYPFHFILCSDISA